MRRLLHSKWVYPVCLCLGLLSAVPLSGLGVIDSISGEVQQVFEKVSPAVVKVRASGGYQPLAGTGFFIDGNGTLLTSYEVVRESPRVWIEYHEQKLEAQVLGRDQRSGVALLKVQEKNTPFLTMGNSDGLKIASGLISVAYAYNLPLSPSFGFVKGFDVRYLNRFFATSHVRADVSVCPGQIGGPLLNSRGEVVAMMVLAIQDGKECYGIPMKAAQRVVADIRSCGYVKHGWAGVGVVEGHNPAADAKAVLVSQLYSNTPAALSGLKQGDQVIAIGKRPVTDPRDILDAAFFARVGDTVPVTVLRNGTECKFSIKVVERPASSSLVDRKLVEQGPDGLTRPFVLEPGAPDSSGPAPIRVHGTQP